MRTKVLSLNETCFKKISVFLLLLLLFGKKGMRFYAELNMAARKSQGKRLSCDSSRFTILLAISREYGISCIFVVKGYRSKVRIWILTFCQDEKSKWKPYRTNAIVINAWTRNLDTNKRKDGWSRKWYKTTLSMENINYVNC